MKTPRSFASRLVPFALAAAVAGAVSARAAAQFLKNVMVPMRDGTRLAANVFLPSEKGAFPVILTRTPYGKGGEKAALGAGMRRLGYAVVSQDCRGRGDSEGKWDPFRYDVQDGQDTLKWVIAQPWCNGRIGTAGGSYVGWTQWALAPGAPPQLKAMVPMVPFAEAYPHAAYPGGAFQLALCFGWGAGVGGIRADANRLRKAFEFLPLNRWDEQFDRRAPYLRDWIAHSTYDAYWRRRGVPGRYKDIAAPILNIGGWYDIFSKPVIEMIERVRHESKSRLARRNQCVVVGPWAHGPAKRRLGELDFGPEAELNVMELQLKWFEYWLKGKETGVEDWPPLLLFVMGENKWRPACQWPPRGVKFVSYYLASGGKANSLGGDGRLALRPPEGQTPPDRFVYDPNRPVPTHGGNNLAALPSGPFDQTEIEKRSDVLVYTTPPLEEPVCVIGPVRLVLHAASTAPDTDFTVKLADVHPDGRAFNLCDGILRARFRRSNVKPSLIRPGKTYRYEIEAGVTANLFKKGHRIRIEVSSSNFPRFDRNANSGLPLGTDTKLLKATQTVYHDRARPSRLVLPVAPR